MPDPSAGAGGEANVGEGEASCMRWNLDPASAGDRFEGMVLLRPMPPELEPVVLSGLRPVGVPGDETPGLPRSLEWPEETETFLRTPNLRRLSAPALAFDADRPTVLFGLGDRVAPTPLSTSLTVFSSTAVPVMPIRKLSWFSIKKIRTS